MDGLTRQLSYFVVMTVVIMVLRAPHTWVFPLCAEEGTTMLYIFPFSVYSNPDGETIPVYCRDRQTEA